MNLSNQRLPILIAAIAVGILLIAGGVGVKASQDQAIEVAVGQTATASIPDTSTPYPTFTSFPSSTPTQTDTPTATSTGTLPATNTPTITPTSSPTPVRADISHLDLEGYPTPINPPSTAIPTPAAAVEVPPGVVNILLLGSDKRPEGGGYRTDTIIVVSVNRNEGTVNMLSIPRDVWVYIPGWTMNRINTADGRGAAVGWEGGGPGLIKETLLYNFGITIHHYARVDFSSFQDIVDAIGGVDVAVDCSISGYTLKEPRQRQEDFASFDAWADYTDPEAGNWELTTLDVGVHHLDGYEALWYARVRKGTTDFDRARRQQQVLRAILSQSQSLGLVTRAPELWVQYNDLVETDMGLGNMLELAPVGADLDSSKMRSFILTPAELIPWIDPDTNASVFLPNPDAVNYIVGLAMQPPADNYVVSNTATVEVRNGTSVDRLDEVAAERLGWEALITIPTGATTDGGSYEKTVIYDFTGRAKTSQLLTLQRILKVGDSEIIVQPDPNRVVDYVVILGQNYTSCTYNPQRPIAPVPATPIPPTAVAPTETQEP